MFPQVFYIDVFFDMGQVLIGGVEYLYSSFVVPCHLPVLIFKIEQDIPDTDNVLGFRVGFRVKNLTLPISGRRNFRNTGFVLVIYWFTHLFKVPPSEEGGLGVLYLVYEELGQFLPLLEVVVLYKPTIVDHEEFFVHLLLVDNITGILHTP